MTTTDTGTGPQIVAAPPGTALDYTDAERQADLRWWAAANYLTIAQIYLQDNPLLREPLRVEHINTPPHRCQDPSKVPAAGGSQGAPPCQ